MSAARHESRARAASPGDTPSSRIHHVRRARRLAWLWVPPLALMGAIYVSSSQADIVAPSLISDKGIHGGVYGLLGLLLLRGLAEAAWSGVTGRTVLLAVALATAYGLSDEWHQSFVPGRTAEWADLVADAAGASLATGAAWSCGIIRRALGRRM